MDQTQIRQIAGRLIDLRAQLLAQYPFFGRLLMHLPFGFAECGTAYTDMSRIVFDPAFAFELDDEQLRFVMLHELMHCVLKHCTRGRGKLHQLYNIACDIVVNSIILEALHTDEIIIAGNPAMHLTPKGDEGRCYSAEEVYEMLCKAPEGSEVKAYGNLALDSHDVWDKISEDTLLDEKWDKYTKDAGRGASKFSGIPDSVQRIVNSVNRKPKIAWQQVLHDYIQYKCGDYVFSPPDKRYSGDFILPSFSEAVFGASIDKIWYLIDTSGSVKDDEIAEAFGEIKDAAEQIGDVQGMVSFFDYGITNPVPFSNIEDIDDMIPVGGGGTSFEVIFKYLAEHMEEDLPRVMVIITDGYADYPDESAALGVPVIWLIVDSEMEPPFGEVLHVYTKA